HVLALDKAGVLQSLAKCAQKVRVEVGRRGTEHADHWHRLLRTRREWPRGSGAAEQRDELAPVHCPISPVLPTERIAHLSYCRRLLHCGISIRPMSGWHRATRVSGNYGISAR